MMTDKCMMTDSERSPDFIWALDVLHQVIHSSTIQENVLSNWEKRDLVPNSTPHLVEYALLHCGHMCRDMAVYPEEQDMDPSRAGPLRQYQCCFYRYCCGQRCIRLFDPCITYL